MTASTTSPSPPLPSVAPAQLKAALWADAASQVHALVLGRRVPGLAAQLGQADVADHDCLWPGALSEAERGQAPYLVWLKRESPFTDWLLFEAAAGFGEWGVLLRSGQSFLALRRHCRELCRARLPDGQEIALDWMDPPVLRALLSLASADQVEQILSPFQSLVMVGGQAWTHCSQQWGRLQMQQQLLLAA